MERDDLLARTLASLAASDAAVAARCDLPAIKAELDGLGFACGVAFCPKRWWSARVTSWAKAASIWKLS